MFLNSTLFIQIFHFGIAYLILTKIFFKPAVQQLLQEDANALVAHTELTVALERVLQQTTYNQKTWLLLQQKLQKNTPSFTLHESCAIDIMYNTIEEPLSEAALITQAHALTQVIVKRAHRA